MTNIYTGRLDMITEEEDMIFLFHCLIDKFECNNFIFCFEDKTRTGLTTKPHYHFILETPYKSDTIRKWLSSNGFPKSLASIKENIGVKDKAYNYVLKQQQIIFSDYDEVKLNQLLEQSNNYQQDIKPTLNTWKDHLEQIILKLEHADISRTTILYTIYEYIYEFNQVQGQRLNKPANISQTISYIESKILTKKEYIKRQMQDDQRILFTNREMLVEADKQLYKDDERQQYFESMEQRFIARQIEQREYYINTDTESDDDAII